MAGIADNNTKLLDDLIKLLTTNIELYQEIEKGIIDPILKEQIETEKNNLERTKNLLKNNQNEIQLFALTQGVQVVKQRIVSGHWTLKDKLMKLLNTDKSLTTNELFKQLKEIDPENVYEQRETLKKISATMGVLLKENRIVREKNAKGLWAYNKK